MEFEPGYDAPCPHCIYLERALVVSERKREELSAVIVRWIEYRAEWQYDAELKTHSITWPGDRGAASVWGGPCPQSEWSESFKDPIEALGDFMLRTEEDEDD